MKSRSWEGASVRHMSCSSLGFVTGMCDTAVSRSWVRQVWVRCSKSEPLATLRPVTVGKGFACGSECFSPALSTPGFSWTIFSQLWASTVLFAAHVTCGSGQSCVVVICLITWHAVSLSAIPPIIQIINDRMSQSVDIQLKILQTLLSSSTSPPYARLR
jgi:hypothetical protein